MAVWVPGPSRHDREARPDLTEEGRCRGCRAAVVRHLEDVHGWNTSCGENWIDIVFDVTGQQEPAAGDLAEEHYGNIVDAAAGVRWLLRNPSRIRPQDPEPDVIEGDSRASREQRPRKRVVAKLPVEGGIAWSGTAHARLIDSADPVALEQ